LLHEGSELRTAHRDDVAPPRNLQRILKLNAELSDCATQLGEAESEPHGPVRAGLAKYPGDYRAAH
jgi:hypothetical protein